MILISRRFNEILAEIRQTLRRSIDGMRKMITFAKRKLAVRGLSRQSRPLADSIAAHSPSYNLAVTNPPSLAPQTRPRDPIYAVFLNLASAAWSIYTKPRQRDGGTGGNDETHSSSLLLDKEKFESFEIRSRPSLLDGRSSLSPGRLLPLGEDTRLLEYLLDGGSTGGSGELLEDEGGEDQSSVGEGLSGNSGARSFDESLA